MLLNYRSFWLGEEPKPGMTILWRRIEDSQQTTFYSTRLSGTLVSCTMKSIKTPPWRNFLPMKTSSPKPTSNCQCQTNHQYPPPRTPVDTTYYSRGNVPPGMYQSGYRPFAGANSPGGGGGGQPAQSSQPPATPQRWALPRHPAPPKAPTPPAPWVLTAGHVAPYNEFKPKILKEVNDFHGDSNDISRFFLKCELHFSVFNRHYF